MGRVRRGQVWLRTPLLLIVFCLLCPGGCCAVCCRDKLPAPGREEHPEGVSCRRTVLLGLLKIRDSALCPSRSVGVGSEELLKEKDISLPVGALSACTNRLLQLSVTIILAAIVGFAAILLVPVPPLAGLWVLPGISAAVSL